MITKSNPQFPFPIKRIEFKYKYKLRGASPQHYKTVEEAVLYYENDIAEQLQYRWEDIIMIARQAELNRREFFILDTDNSAAALEVAVDKAVFSKADDGNQQIIFHQPAIHRISLGLISARKVRQLLLLLQTNLILLGILYITTNSLRLLLLPVFITTLVYSLKKSKTFFRYLWRERKTFSHQQDYPRITLGKECLVYERYGKQHIIPWGEVKALNYEWRNTVLHTVSLRSYPIPTYELISIFSTKYMVEKIIEFAGLKQPCKKSKLWLNTTVS